MTVEEDRADLDRHEREIDAHESFNYAIFDADESALLGCVYVDPPEFDGADAEICWWVVDEMVDSDLEEVLEVAVPVWIAVRVAAAPAPLHRPRPHLGRVARTGASG